MANKAIHCILNTLSCKRKPTNEQIQNYAICFFFPLLHHRRHKIKQSRVEKKREYRRRDKKSRNRERERAHIQSAESLDR